MSTKKIVVLVSANSEWRAVLDLYADAEVSDTPYGEYFIRTVPLSEDGRKADIVFLQGGWGKVSAAASAQYAISTWEPELIINLGTCGGFEGKIERFDVVLVKKTIIYDIFEQMGDIAEAIAHYSTELDLEWLTRPFPFSVHTKVMLSGDRDLDPAEVEPLYQTYHAVVGDWESASIAFVAQHNGIRCLILRMVTDLVSSKGGEVYDGKIEIFHQRAAYAMEVLLSSLPEWLVCAGY
jgi:adenosylhomocysteine nucleosidase